MNESFTFCGRDIKDLGLQYIPEKTNVYPYKPATFSNQEESFEGHDGGYSYGGSYKPKEFELKCYFEDKDVITGYLTDIEYMFKPGITGELIFNSRKWCKYIATVTSNYKIDQVNMRDGIITFYLKAFYPFSRSDKYIILENDEDKSALLRATAMLEDGKESMPSMEITDGESITEQTEILLYNPGIVDCDVSISIAGDSGDGVEIRNITTGQACRFINLTKAETTSQNKYIICDGTSGKTVMLGGSVPELAFKYHDSGFIKLKNSFPIIRDVTFTSNGTNLLVPSIQLPDTVVGKYICVNGSWYNIISKNYDGNIFINNNISAGENTSSIVEMNKIIITPDTTMDITKLSFIYKPTFY